MCRHCLEHVAPALTNDAALQDGHLAAAGEQQWYREEQQWYRDEQQWYREEQQWQGEEQQWEELAQQWQELFQQWHGYSCLFPTDCCVAAY